MGQDWGGKRSGAFPTEHFDGRLGAASATLARHQRFGRRSRGSPLLHSDVRQLRVAHVLSQGGCLSLAQPH